MKSLYKEGDKVVIRSTYHSDSTDADYPSGFLKHMLMDYGGRTCTIDHVYFTTLGNSRKHYVEPFAYSVRENEYYWTAAMFENEYSNSPSIFNILI